jgi:hypothetical protein
MNKLLLAALALAVPLYAAPAPTPVAGYTGTWTLDQAQSKDLPPYYANVKSHLLDIAQGEGTLDVVVKIANEQPEPQQFDFHYTLDGTATRTITKVRTFYGMTDVPTTMQATRTADGGLTIAITRQIKMGERQFQAASLETWTLAADGKTLTVHRADDTPAGRTESDMVFVRLC